MNIIPLKSVASQTFAINLAGQDCTINVYQKTTGLYLDLYVGTTAIITTQICLDRVKLVRYAYLGFIGDLAFMDTQGVDDPVYTGLGSRFQLMYLSASEV